MSAAVEDHLTEEQLLALKEQMEATREAELEKCTASENCEAEAHKEECPHFVAENAPTTPEPEPEDEASILRRIKDINEKVDREDERHVKRYREIMGDDFDQTYKECPLCQLAGWAFPYEGQMLEDQRAAVSIVLGEGAPQELKHSPYSRTCDTCGGAGVYLTGATAEHSRVMACEDCAGNGWLTVPRAIPVPTLSAVPAPPVLPTPTVGDPGAPFDQFGREAGHPHFGMEPKYIR